MNDRRSNNQTCHSRGILTVLAVFFFVSLVKIYLLLSFLAIFSLYFKTINQAKSKFQAIIKMYQPRQFPLKMKHKQKFPNDVTLTSDMVIICPSNLIPCFLRLLINIHTTVSSSPFRSFLACSLFSACTLKENRIGKGKLKSLESLRKDKTNNRTYFRSLNLTDFSSSSRFSASFSS